MYTMYYMHAKPHLGGKQKFYLETHNECVVILLCYHLMIFTDFIPNNDINGTFIMGYAFVICIAEILFSNIALMLYQIAKAQQLERKKQRIQKQYER